MLHLTSFVAQASGGNQDNATILLVTALVVFAGGFLIKIFLEIGQSRDASRRLRDAQQRAFGRQSEDGESAKSPLSLDTLLDLNSKQIAEYQTETRQRASWSFLSAILAMAAGLALVFWGVRELLDGTTQSRVTGATVSGLGAALSAYITKTFLDVHKLSLRQLNRYFRQPVINSHILTAQRLAERLESAEARAAAYQQLIASVIALVRDQDTGPAASPPKSE